MAVKTKKVKESVEINPEKSVEENIIAASSGKLDYLNSDVLSGVTHWISTGSYKLNEIISRGRGLPGSKIVTITGRKSVGKTTIVAHLIAEGQKLGAVVVLFDTEFAFDMVRAQKIGVNPENLILGQPDCLEDIFQQLENIAENAAKSDRLVLIVWDSVAATPTRKEFEGTLGEGGHYGEHSKVLSQGFRKITGLLSRNNILLFIVNQIKTNINAGLYQSDVTYIGKNPLDFHSHVMLEITQASIEKENEIPVAITSRVKVSKNRVGPPFREAIIKINFEDGLDTDWEAMELGKSYGRIRMNGAWHQVVFACPSCTTGKDNQGKKCSKCDGSMKVIHQDYKQFYGSNIKTYLEEHPGLKEWLIFGTGPIAKKLEDGMLTA